MKQRDLRGSTCNDAINLDDFREMAKDILPLEIFDYIDCGGCDESTYRANRDDMDAIRLLPLIMRPVQQIDLSVTLGKHAFRVPIGISPTAFHRMAHEDGEIAAASAAKALGAPMVVSSMSSFALEEIAEKSQNDQLWLQTYIFKDRALTTDLLQRGELAGYKAIVLTVGTPVSGKRDRNLRNRFVLPESVAIGNFSHISVVAHNNPVHSFVDASLDAEITWKDVNWLRGVTRLPVYLKGLINPRDVSPALDSGASGLIVSNHGGRQLDTTISTINILPEIVDIVDGRVPLIVDSGFRRGTDVLKAIALGANAVFLGRPVLWALAVGGHQSIMNAIQILTEELHIGMQLVGCRDLRELRMNATSILRR